MVAIFLGFEASPVAWLLAGFQLKKEDRPKFIVIEVFYLIINLCAVLDFFVSKVCHFSDYLFFY